MKKSLTPLKQHAVQGYAMNKNMFAGIIICMNLLSLPLKGALPKQSTQESPIEFDTQSPQEKKALRDFKKRFTQKQLTTFRIESSHQQKMAYYYQKKVLSLK